MATTIYVRDTENYPSIQKTISVDLAQLVPVGVSGDERWMVSLITTAYSDIATTTAISDVYVRTLYRGWSRSSGLEGGSFTITAATNDKLAVNIDNQASALATYTITLDAGVNIPGETVAEDIETKLRALAATGESQAGDLGYLNCEVEFVDNKFWIYSGTVASSWTSSTRSSVQVVFTSTNDSRVTLGFKVPLESYTLGSNPCQITETSAEYTGDAATMSISTPAWTVAAGQAYMISDGDKTEYFASISGSNSTTLNVGDSSANSFIAVSGTYAAGSMIVYLQRGDDAYPVVSPIATVDDTIRWGLMTVVNQIDFSS